MDDESCIIRICNSRGNNYCALFIIIHYKGLTFFVDKLRVKLRDFSKGDLYMEIGLVQVYCGNGKGKTTSAIGQGIRATGRGLKVIMIQFLKGRPTGELKTLSKLEPDFKVFRFEKERGFYKQLTSTEQEELKMEIENAMKFAKKIFDTKECDVLILDEILGVLENKIISDEELSTFIKSKPQNMELILTGRKLPEGLKEYADYISEINVIKHPYTKGINAREGIEY